MSRVSLKGRDETISEVVVGIDPPLQCWFAQVYKSPEEDPVVCYDRASRSQLLETITAYADMDDVLTKQAYNLIVLDLDPGDLTRDYMESDPPGCGKW